jgi:hypothetical protein
VIVIIPLDDIRHTILLIENRPLATGHCVCDNENKSFFFLKTFIMKKANNLAFRLVGVAIIFGLFTLLSGCTNRISKVKSDINKDEANLAKVIIWHIKAIHPEGRIIDVKAFDKDGNIYDVKGVKDSNQRQFIDIKAFVGEEKLPIKILVSDDKYSPVKAIGKDGTLYDIKALTPEGDKLDVKGVSRAGNIINIKAIDKEGAFYGIKAISPEGQLNDVKGVKMSKENLELMVNGVEVYAHIKALPQTGCVSDNSIWHIKVFHSEGRIIDVKAFDKDGKIYDVKAIQDSNQQQLIDIKALVGEEKIPIKILVSNDKYFPVKAIGKDGTVYDIKALTPEGDKLDVKGVGRAGNIINIKAIDKNGAFYGIKAMSPEGLLNDVKGIKVSKVNVELIVNGVEVYAHIKALPQIN